MEIAEPPCIFSNEVYDLNFFLKVDLLQKFDDEDFKHVQDIIQKSFDNKLNDVEDQENLLIPLEQALRIYLSDPQVQNTEDERKRYDRFLDIRKNILTRIKSLVTNYDQCLEIRQRFREHTLELHPLSVAKFGIGISRIVWKQEQAKQATTANAVDRKRKASATAADNRMKRVPTTPNK
jgi:hypothetical protein